MTEREKMLS